MFYRFPFIVLTSYIIIKVNCYVGDSEPNHTMKEKKDENEKFRLRKMLPTQENSFVDRTIRREKPHETLSIV